MQRFISTSRNSIRKFSSVALNQSYGAGALVFSSDAMSWNPGAKDVIVKMEAAIVSKDDVQHSNGLSATYSRLGIQGSTGVGIINSVGSAVQNLKKSDRVFVFSQKGTWADSVSTSENHVFSTKHEAGVFHSVLTSWALLNSVPAVPNQTVLFDTLSTPNGAMIKKVAQILKINVTEIGAKKDALADVVFCTNSSAKDLLRNVKNGGSLVICNADSAGTVQVPYSASIFNNIHVRGFNMNAFMGSDNFLSGCAVVENMLNENKLNVDAKKFELKNYANAIKATETAKDGVVVLTM